MILRKYFVAINSYCIYFLFIISIYK